jgi:hypothetical protein
MAVEAFSSDRNLRQRTNEPRIDGDRGAPFPC